MSYVGNSVLRWNKSYVGDSYSYVGDKKSYVGDSNSFVRYNKPCVGV